MYSDFLHNFYFAQRQTSNIAPAMQVGQQVPYLSMAHSCASVILDSTLPDAKSYTITDLSAEVLRRTAPSWVNATPLQESLCSSMTLSSVNSVPEQSMTLIPPSTNPAATNFPLGWKQQSCSKFSWDQKESLWHSVLLKYAWNAYGTFASCLKSNKFPRRSLYFDFRWGSSCPMQGCSWSDI